MNALSRFVRATAATFVLTALLPAQHQVVATTPDLAALARAVGGELVAVTALVKGPEDPHALEARPSMLRAVSRTEVLVEIGRELEIGWLPPLVSNARNGAVLFGQPGRIDASAAVRALGVPLPGTTRTAGDVHAFGNPHYLLDPLCGLQVAALLRDRFAALWPAERAAFTANFETFEKRLCVAMVGEELAKAYEYEAERLALAFGAGTLADVLKSHGDQGRLGGWFGALARLRGSEVAAEHDLWPYFAERFGLVIVGFCEPKPGVAPSTAHLEALIATMREQSVRAVLSAPYFAPQHAAFVARATGARIAEMAHQVDARPGTDDYVAFVDHNVRALAAALVPQAAGH